MVYSHMVGNKIKFDKLWTRVLQEQQGLIQNLEKHLPSDSKDLSNIKDTIKNIAEFIEQNTEKSLSERPNLFYKMWNTFFSEHQQDLNQIIRDLEKAEKNFKNQIAVSKVDVDQAEQRMQKREEKIRAIKADIFNKNSQIGEIDEKLASQQDSNFTGQRISESSANKQKQKIEGEILKLNTDLLRLERRNPEQPTKQDQSSQKPSFNVNNQIQNLEKSLNTCLSSVLNLADKLREIASDENAEKDQVMFAQLEVCGISKNDLDRMVTNAEHSQARREKELDRQLETPFLLGKIASTLEKKVNSLMRSLLKANDLEKFARDFGKENWRPKPWEDVITKKLKEVSGPHIKQAMLDFGQSTRDMTLLQYKEELINYNKELASNILKYAKDNLKDDDRKLAYLSAIYLKLLVSELQKSLK
jgi:hypothetical protein